MDVLIFLLVRRRVILLGSLEQPGELRYHDQTLVKNVENAFTLTLKLFFFNWSRAVLQYYISPGVQQGD